MILKGFLVFLLHGYWSLMLLGVDGQLHVKLNSTLRQHVMNIGKKMFGIGNTKDGVSTPNPYETFSWWQKIDRHNFQQRKKDRNKRKTKVGTINTLGQIGPPGPPGPAGEPGDKMSVPEIMSELRKALRSKNIQATLRSGGSNTRNAHTMAGRVADIIAGFAVTTMTNIPTAKRSHVELNAYQVSANGGFLRGNSFNQRTGRFTAKITAVYSFHAAVHISIPRGSKDLTRKDFISLSLCISGNCNQNKLISSKKGIESNSRIFTISVDAYLHLQAGQYVSLYIHNNSNKYLVTVLSSSYFTGILVGT